MIEFPPVNTPLEVTQKPAVLPEEDAQRLKLRKATQEFESLFIDQLLKNMRRISWNSEGDGFGKDVMMEAADEAVSRQLAKSGMLGIGDLLYQRLVARLESSPTPPPENPGPIELEVYRPSSGIVADTLSRYGKEIDTATRETGLAPDLLAAVINTESSGNAKAISPKGAVGLMQLMPDTAAEVGVDNPEHPGQNILGGARYLKKLLDRFGDLRLALAAYNAGPGRVEEYGDIPPFQETRNYVDLVMSTLKESR